MHSPPEAPRPASGSPSHGRFRFDPERHEDRLKAILGEVAGFDDPADFDDRELDRILRRHPRPRGGFYSKVQLVRSWRVFAARGDDDLPLTEAQLTSRLRMKPVRTLSGVAPVTVLTRPHPCPGKCIFCPNDVRSPKSYLSNEPGVRRAVQHGYDPYLQTRARLTALHHMGHPVSKVETIVLGGTWSFYPESYRIWFVLRCFEAMNDFDSAAVETPLPPPKTLPVRLDGFDDELDGRTLERTYNQVVTAFLRDRRDGLEREDETASWEALEAAQRANETARARCVGLVLETRPDHLDAAEVVRLRRLGATKVQIGIQSTSDEVLAKNKRGHDTASTRRAIMRLRRAGFKIHGHWMANLYGSDPEADVEDFSRLFADLGYRPDELKLYPCSLIESAELMRHYEDGSWRPYERDELLEVLVRTMAATPAYCRLTRVIRDIPGTDIVTGNKTTNFREVVERELERRGVELAEIRSREVRKEAVDWGAVRFEALEYDTEVSREVFLQALVPETGTEDGADRLAGFLRLSLPTAPLGDLAGLDELEGRAMIREIHVYGAQVEVGEEGEAASQHRGLGRQLVCRAAERAREAGFTGWAVISSVGTREYYRGLGFEDGGLYQVAGL